LSESNQFNKRLLLVRLYKLFLLISFLGLLTPFLLSLTVFTSDAEKEVVNKWAVSVPVKNLSSGKIHELPWSGGLFWVYKRTEKDIRSLKANNSQSSNSQPNNSQPTNSQSTNYLASNYQLRDAGSKESDQPINMANHYRSADENFFIFVPLESKRACQVRLNDDGSTIKFIEPCFGSKYDVAGRIFKESGHKDQKNLSVPMHKIENGILKIAVWIKSK